MINLFDLGAGIGSAKVLADQAHRDGSPVRRSRQDIKTTADPAKVCTEDKLRATIRSSWSNKSDASRAKRLVSKEMSKEVESNRKPPSVVARLMGLEDGVPAQEPSTHYGKRNRSHSMDNLAAAATRHLQRQEQHNHSKTAQDIHKRTNETVEFKDVYAVCEEPLRTHHLQDQTPTRGRSSGDKSGTRMEVARQKLMEAKCLVTDENLLHTKEFQEAFDVPTSIKDLSRSVLSKQPNAQSNRITVLKPLKSVENKGVRRNTTTRIIEENDFVMGRTHQRSHSAEGTFSQPTKIVVLKPSTGKLGRGHAKLTPHAAPYELTEQTNLFKGLEADVSTEDLHRPDESSLSSVYSNGYGADESSFGRSEAEYIDEDGGSLSDSDVASPVSQHTWDYIKRYNSPYYSGSTYSKVSHSQSPESSVIKEAKRRLSERWTTVAYNDTSQEQVKLPRISRTLGDMLSIQEAKKEEIFDVINSVSGSRLHGTENELAMQATFIAPLREDETGESSPRNLARSNSESCNTSMVERSSKGKLSLKGKVSSFFFSRSKRLTKEKPTPPYDSSDDRTEVTIIGDMRPGTDNDHDIDEQMACRKDVSDNSDIQTICSSKDVKVSVSSDCPSGYINDQRSKGGLKCIHDQPSPTSVLHASFEDNNSTEPESSKNINSCSEIEPIARSLSWEVTNYHSPLHGSLKYSSAEDDELEFYSLVQKIISSAGLLNLQLSMAFTGWYSPDCPLDPSLCDRFLDRKEEDAKSRERRSKQKLIFDSVNMALIETGQEALLSTYPWSKTCLLGAWREPLSQPLLELVWSHVRDWLHHAARFAANENGDDTGAMLERIMQQEVVGSVWRKSTRSELDEITKQIAVLVLEELIGEEAKDLSNCSWQLGICNANVESPGNK